MSNSSLFNNVRKINYRMKDVKVYEQVDNHHPSSYANHPLIRAAYMLGFPAGVICKYPKNGYPQTGWWICVGEVDQYLGENAAEARASLERISIEQGLSQDAIDIRPVSAKKWIPVSERLPVCNEPLTWFNDETGRREPFIENDHATVLAYNDQLGIYKAQYSKMGWNEISSISISGGKDAIPTHWMPLPETPKI
jgi:hypothetical protein